MKKDFLFFLLAASVVTMVSVSCNNANTKTTQEAVGVVTEVLSVDDLLASADSLTGKQVVAEGVCTHICRHGAKKIFLMGSDDTKTVRVEASDVIGAFKPECMNSLVEVEGVLVEQRIDEAYLVDWEERIKAETDEKHGDGEAGCAAEQKAQNETSAATPQKRIDNFRKRITERKEKENKDYLSFYYIEGKNYTITK